MNLERRLERLEEDVKQLGAQADLEGWTDLKNWVYQFGV